VLCGIVCLLLIVLWVRSYWWQDLIIGNISPHINGLNLSSESGQIKYTDVRRSDIAPSQFAILSRRRDEIFHVPSGFDTKVVAEFGVSLVPASWSIAAPHWFVALISVGLGSLPWFRRFSLRTLLIATTLVAVVLGLIAYATR
jgi:hypothetical protein